MSDVFVFQLSDKRLPCLECGQLPATRTAERKTRYCIHCSSRFRGIIGSEIRRTLLLAYEELGLKRIQTPYWVQKGLSFGKF